MGDILEFSTSHKPQALFYKTTSNAVAFQIKGIANAAICLSRAPNPKSYICWILLNNNNITFMVNERRVRGVGSGLINNFLSMNEFKKFWITWINGILKIGEGNVITPLASIKHNVSDIKYVAFVLLDQLTVLRWKCHLPPLCMRLMQPTFKAVKGGETKWVKMNKELPNDSVIGGYENEILYIMRAFHETALTPGKYVPSSGKGFVSWGGLMHEKDDFEILCGFDCIWVSTYFDKIPLGAVEAGYVEETHEIMYVGRVIYDGHFIPGKIAPSHNVCYIPYKGKEIARSSYDILVNPCHKQIRKLV